MMYQTKIDHEPTDNDYIVEAQQIYLSDDIEFDACPKTSIADGGAWVQAWVWVDDNRFVVEENKEQTNDT